MFSLWYIFCLYNEKTGGFGHGEQRGDQNGGASGGEGTAGQNQPQGQSDTAPPERDYNSRPKAHQIYIHNAPEEEISEIEHSGQQTPHHITRYQTPGQYSPGRSPDQFTPGLKSSQCSVGYSYAQSDRTSPGQSLGGRTCDDISCYAANAYSVCGADWSEQDSDKGIIDDKRYPTTDKDVESLIHEAGCCGSKKKKNIQNKPKSSKKSKDTVQDGKKSGPAK